MKKFLLLLLSIIAFTFTCNAQLTIKSDKSSLERIGTIRPTYSSLYYDDEFGYHLTINSSNQFDDLYIISLGQDEIAIETLSTLIKIGEAEERVTVENNNKEYTIYGKKFLGIPAIFIQGEYYAGYCSLNVSELKKALKIINNHIK